LHGVQGVVSSNLAIPTKKAQRIASGFFYAVSPNTV